MPAQTVIAPYIICIVTLINKRSKAELEISCKSGEGNINISHDQEEWFKRLILIRL